MDVIGIVGRLNGCTQGAILSYLNDQILEQNVLGKAEMDILSFEDTSIVRQMLLTWMLLYFGSILLYFVAGGLDYLAFFVVFKKRFIPQYEPDYKEMRREISMSLQSLFVMTGFVTPMEMLINKGYSKLYDNVYDYGLVYFFASPLLFLIFSDAMIYWVHRGLHHRLIYKYIHKPHHSFIHTTPFAAFAFHPIDGYLQGVAYQIFVFCIPLHSFIHLISLSVVAMWTINIHDRVDLKIPFVNGAGHHTIHHTTFRSNYGQYFTFSDRLFGTFKDPKAWKHVVHKEDEVYGDDAKKL